MERSIHSPSRNSQPLSTVMLLKIVGNRPRCLFSIRSSTAATHCCVLFSILNSISRPLTRSVNTSKHAFVPAFPTTQSISQCPCSCRSSTCFGRCSMLFPFKLVYAFRRALRPCCFFSCFTASLYCLSPQTGRCLCIHIASWCIWSLVYCVNLTL